MTFSLWSTVPGGSGFDGLMLVSAQHGGSAGDERRDTPTPISSESPSSPNITH